MGNRVLLGNRSTGGYGFYVSKSGQNVLTCADKELLFDSRTSRTGQIYAGANNLSFVDDSSDQEATVRGTTNRFSTLLNQVNLNGKKIIIDGTTVTLSTTTTSYFGGTNFTTVDNIVTDINAASISGVTANRSNISSTDHRLRITKTTSDMVITYPASNSLETLVGIAAATYDYPDLSSNGVNWINSSGTTKASLGYIPLLILSETNSGAYDFEESDGDEEFMESVSRISLWRTTATHMYPASADANTPSVSAASLGNDPVARLDQATHLGAPTNIGRDYYADDVDNSMTNASFFVLRIPCGYGYMNSTYFG